MNQIIGVTELQRRFRSVFDQVVKERTSYILTRGSRPEAALIPYEDYVRIQSMSEDDVLERFDRLMEKMRLVNAGRSEEEVQADVEAAIREVREEKRKYQAKSG
ncbi:MAG: type II toxin-antitoxin system Phd/YefM family antitoxin [Chloroflexota bacterium]